MKAYVLIEAEEGRFGDHFAAPSRELLVQGVKDFYRGLQSEARHPADTGYYDEIQKAVLMMLATAPDTPGSHDLTPIDPCWQPWLLVIVEMP